MDRQQHKAAAMVGGLKVEFKWDQQQNGRASEMFFSLLLPQAVRM